MFALIRETFPEETHRANEPSPISDRMANVLMVLAAVAAFAIGLATGVIPH